MSVASTVFVACKKEQVLEIGKAVVDSLSEFAIKKTDEYWEKHTDAFNRMHFLHADKFKNHGLQFSNGCVVDSYNFETFSFSFGCGDSLKRSVSMFTQCSTDYSEVFEGHKVIFHVSCWGMYDEIMKLIAETVKPYGDVYYDFNDCDDEDFIKL
jgi:hypothetical protein